jgi:hypothetical protein
LELAGHLVSVLRSPLPLPKLLLTDPVLLLVLVLVLAPRLL